MEIIEHPVRMLYLLQAYPIRLGDRDKTQPAEFELNGSHVVEVKMMARPVNPNFSQISTVVKVGSPFKLSAGDRRVFAGAVLLGVAQPAGLHQGEYLYELCITLISKLKEATTTVPKYAAVEIQGI